MKNVAARKGLIVLAASAVFYDSASAQSAPVANRLCGVKRKRLRISVAGIKFAIYVNTIDVDYVGSLGPSPSTNYHTK